MERKWLKVKNLAKLKDFQESMLKSIQHQMMDSMRPMLHVWNQLKAVESSLKLLGSAFANVSKLRRENVIRHVVPSMKPMLKDPRAFSSREYERLLGSKFIDVMVKEVDDHAKLKKSVAMTVPHIAKIVATAIGAMAVAIKAHTIAVITRAVG